MFVATILKLRLTLLLKEYWPLHSDHPYSFVHAISECSSMAVLHFK